MRVVDTIKRGERWTATLALAAGEGDFTGAVVESRFFDGKTYHQLLAEVVAGQILVSASADVTAGLALGLIEWDVKITQAGAAYFVPANQNIVLRVVEPATNV